MGVFWGLGTIYTIIDLTNKPAAMRRYKIQPGTNEPVETARLIKVMIHAPEGRQQLLHNIFCLLLAGNWPGVVQPADSGSTCDLLHVLSYEMARNATLTRTTDFPLGPL